jgi:sugar/nucleoside kinase (ribokinase family)
MGPYPSGAPAIFISTAAQLGNKAKIWGGVGADKFGEVLLTRLKNDGVDVSGVKTGEKGATGVAFVAYSSGGEREFIFHIDGTPSGDVTFTETPDIPDYFHVMGCSLTVNEKMKAAIEKACVYYSEKGAKISFDPNIRPSLLGKRDIMDIAGTVMENCSVFLPGVDELLLFAGGRADIADAAKYLFGRFPRLEIIHVKKGKRGSQIITKTEQIDIPIYPIEKKYPVVDPTGSGDSFDAAFVSAIANGKSLKEAGDLASKAGAINATVMGPMGGNIKEMIYRPIIEEASPPR